jgi:hypothetical protein
VASRYRALLIGNSAYPADEHNLQTLKGPVKDIAVLNRALADPGTGLFADTDVTLLPEASSARAIRAMGRFFGDATRDDVLLFYFSGHGKLDQVGRLHLCMQDTETTDLLATAVSSARINEFADASHARNVVVVLDCCFSGAFRGGDLGDTVSGPGRYVMTSCRGTQLANDATIENSTSHFTQRLVDGLTGAAADLDGDGYVTFSDLYAYVDRRLRETGKQIPQRRVQGDGDLPLARRPQPTPADPGSAPSGGQRAAGGQPAAGPSDANPPDGPHPPDGPQPPTGGRPEPGAASRTPPVPSGSSGGRARPGWSRRTVTIVAVIAVAAAGGGIAGALLTGNGPQGGSPPARVVGYTSPDTYTFTSPWRLKISGTHTTAPDGCAASVVDARSGTEIRQVADQVYGTETYQISDTGTFRWRVNDQTCAVVTLPGTGTATLPLNVPPSRGDTAVFTAPAKVAVHVTDWGGSLTCDLGLYDPVSGALLNFATADKTQGDTVTLDSGGHKSAYLAIDGCGVRASAGT